MREATISEATTNTPSRHRAGERLGEAVIGSRYNGPATTANGGYAAGVVARFLPGAAEVTLRRPPPLDRPMLVAAKGRGVVMLEGQELVAEGEPIESLDLDPPVRPSLEGAREARANHPGIGVRHPLSDCFVCGPERSDGLGVSPGPLPGAPEIGAAPFEPDASVAADGLVRPEVVWATLDCPSYPIAMLRRGRIALLGRLAAERRREIELGERLVAVGWRLASERRKHHTASALLTEEGETVAVARATWIELRGGG